MKARYLTLIFIVLGMASVQAQNQEDALRYSQFNLTGTARYTSLGGAMGAVGADFSSLSSNPAGLGLYRKSEFSFTPSIYSSFTETTYLGEMRDDTKYNINLGNLGVVFTKDLTGGADSPGWKMIQFGFGLVRYNNFNNRILLEGNNSNNSLLTGYVHQADGFAPGNLDRFTTKLAYDTDLIWLPDSASYFYDTDIYRGGVRQQKAITTTGSINEMTFGLGSNYNDRLYLGVSIGIPYIRYNYESTYVERDNADTVYYFKSFERTEELSTRGSGLNIKFGAILRATDWLRLGAAYHSPTFYTGLNDQWEYSMTSHFDNGKSYTATSPKGEYDYELTTPMKVIGSAMIRFGKAGFVSADYEYVDYSEARLNASSYKFFDENDAIRNNYSAVHNLKFGTEWRVSDIYLRGGYALFGSPYKNGINEGKANANQLSFGLGIRDSDYFVDFGYVTTNFDQNNQIYWVPQGFTSPVASNKFSNQAFMLTFGWRY